MNTILEFLGTDHRACDERFAEAEAAVGDGRWEEARGIFSDLRAAMDRHFAMEEKALFPAFETHTCNTVGPTAVMRMEHEQIRALLSDMQRRIDAVDRSGFLGLSETLNVLVQQHNIKEESVLYPMCDRALAASRDELIREMNSLAP